MKGDRHSVEFTTFRPEHKVSLVALQREFFGDWSAARFEKRWEWQYKLNPYCRERPAFIQVGLRGEDVVAHLGAFPLPLRIDGERHIALCGASLAVRKQYPWVAPQLFKELASRTPVVGSGLAPAVKRLFEQCGGAIVPLSRERFLYRRRYCGAVCRRVRSVLPS